jgi:transposase-like protein
MSEPGKSPRRFSSAFKEGIVLRLEAGEKIATVAAENGVRRKLLYQWRDTHWSMGAAGLDRKRGPKPSGRAVGRRERPPSAKPAAAAVAPPWTRRAKPGWPKRRRSAFVVIARSEATKQSRRLTGGAL